MSAHTLHTAVFQKIYSDTYEKLFHFIHRLTGKNDALTDDIVQNVYISLWERIEMIAGTESTLPLLYTIAKRQLIDHYRKTLADQHKVLRWSQQQPTWINTTADHLTFKAIDAGMKKTLADMPERRRKIFLLCREEGLSHREIASQLNISVHSVEQQMNLALKALQKEFRYFQITEKAVIIAVFILININNTN